MTVSIDTPPAAAPLPVGAPIPAEVLDKWQRAVDLLTGLMGVPSGYVMRLHPDKLEVCVSCGDTPKRGFKVKLEPTRFCKKVLELEAPLEVVDSLADPEWADRPEGMARSYLGMPIHSPCGALFGTLCVASDEARAYGAKFAELLAQFRDFIEQDLKVMAEAEARRKMEREQLDRLAEIDKLRRELMANVSHDLRTPLASLKGYLETLLLMDAELTPEARRRYLTIAEKNCDRLTRLVEDLFDVACLDAGAVKPRLEQFRLCELVHDVRQKLALKAEGAGVTLSAETPPGLPCVTGDIAWLERALINLTDNALRHTAVGGAVTLSVDPPEAGWVTLRVADTGVGIAPEILPHIFDRYYRSKDMPGGGKPGSAGLGLPISKRVVELHGGRVRVDSAPGEGTTFEIDLPVDGPVEGVAV
ncbi:MAG: HAMP domain-containing histidine kinase [Myxococcales bacterium]|nr:HAMP domain-containing histidine kinase [Myxococcales bacterium]MCB9525583.1 HAMP domain-containing histidine kinase [Myxococcales bacterium]